MNTAKNIYKTVIHCFKAVIRYLKRVFIALDQLANTLCGGWSDETISSVCYRKSQEKGHYGFKFLKIVLDLVLTPIDQDHCFQSYLAELRREQLPMEYRQR